jgi:phosphoglycerate kinase
MDLVVAEDTKSASGELVRADAVPSGRMALDVGPETVALFAARIAAAKTVLWNGPMGLFENPAFSKGTFELARAVAGSQAFSVVGGGDTAAAIRAAGADVASKIGFISTGGGASLELLEGKQLPGVEALRTGTG